jgi:surface antigen
MKLKQMVIVALFPIVLTACGQLGGPKQTGGTLLGAGLGGLAGSQIGGGKGRLAAVAVGTLLGAFVGNKAGQSLDRADQLFAKQAAQRSLERFPSGRSTTWRNPDNGHSGTFTPTRTFQTAAGSYCREFQQTVTVAGRTQRAFGTACRQPDGSWRITS